MAKKKRNDHADEGSVGFLLSVATMQWSRLAADALRKLDLSPIQYVLLQGLLELQDMDVVMQADLARYVHADVMLTSKHVRELEGKNLLTRATHPNDTRARSLELTRSGLSTLKKASTILQKIDHEVFKGQGDLDRLHKVLLTIQGRNE
jgi:DNA-binding MarR family transcriptional regulator